MKNHPFSDRAEIHQFISDTREETIQHGSEQFPCACYLDHYTNGNDAYPWHWHDELEIAYVTQGKVSAFVNDKQFLLHPGEGILLNRRVLHSFSRQGEAEVYLPNILFLPSLLYGNQESVYWEKYVNPVVLSSGFSYVLLRPDIPWQKEILKQAEKAFSLLTEEGYGYEFYTRDALSKIVLQLGQALPKETAKKAKNQIEINRIRQMLSFIQLHYTEPILVQQIADSAFISRRECMRTFQRIIGASPIQYVIDLRIRKAKQLLRDTDLPLLEIAASCGFQNQSYFTKTFRERVGLSPRKFRKSER